MPRNAPKHILVVDDEPIVRQSVCMVLSLDGHKLKEAPNAEEALSKFDTEFFDVVVTDFKMPGMKGDELARAIKTRENPKPVIMLTGFPPEPKPDEISKILIKPFDAEGLRQALAEID